MRPISGAARLTNARNARARRVANPSLRSFRGFSYTRPSPLAKSNILREERGPSEKDDGNPKEEAEEGAMSRRLSELSETSLEEGGRSARNAVEEAGFDEELRQRLLAKIEDTKFRHENQSAFTEAELGSNVGQGSRLHATSRPWTGSESTEDTVLRMLDDAHKPLRRPMKIPAPRGPSKSVNTGRSKKGRSTGARLASAKDQSALYTYANEATATEMEKEERRRVLRERFTAGARPMPGTVQGLAALANERIEDAIARGQFKNLPRGQKIERDYNASSPFLDTTEYFMNKIIKKQDIVPPWIEKQQEVVQAATSFRSRLRADWRRHAARLIASRGGSLEDQIRRAEQYAAAEAVVNPPLKKEEKINTVDKDGHLSQITLSGDLETNDSTNPGEPTTTVTVTERFVSNLEDAPDSKPPEIVDAAEALASQAANPNIRDGAVFPFRDPHWEQTERAYFELVIENLNSLTRSYNLMAPNLAKKPYFSLERELRSCYADIAPQLAREIRERAMAPKLKIDVFQSREGGVLEQLGGGTAKVYDERRPRYGFREFWRDLFAKRSA